MAKTLSTGISKGSRRAFTLIELLVVVAIITVLIALLLPSLGRARQQARAAAGLSNLKQIGVALYTYAHENVDTLPLGHVAGQMPDTTRCPYYVWYLSINPYMGGQGHTNDDPTLKRPLSKALLDPSAAFNGGECHYSSNAMIIPTWNYHNQGWWNNGTGPQRYNRPYRLIDLQPAGDVIIITDGVQVTYGSAIPNAPRGTATPVAWWFRQALWNYNGVSPTATPRYYRESNGAWPQADRPVRTTTDAVQMAANPNWQLDMTTSFTVPWPTIRFRQLNGQGMNALYGDGHAETKKLDVTNSEFLARRNW